MPETADYRNCPIGAQLAVRVESAEKLTGQTLEAMRKELVSLRESVQKDMAEIRRFLDRHNQVLFGDNGSGLRGTLAECRARLEQLEVKAIKEADMEHAWRLQRWGWVVAIGISVFNFAVQLLR